MVKSDTTKRSSGSAQEKSRFPTSSGIAERGSFHSTKLFHDKKFIILDGGFDGFDQGDGDFGFGDVGAGPDFFCFGDETFINITGENNDGGLRKFLADAASGFEAVEDRHGDIENHHIWFEFLRFIDSFQTVDGLADDLEARFLVQRRFHNLPDQRVVIGYEDADGQVTGLRWIRRTCSWRHLARINKFYPQGKPGKYRKLGRKPS